MILRDKNGKQYNINDSTSIGNGGEGILYSIGNGYVAKLYFNSGDAISQKKIDELSLLDSSLFIKPLTALYGAQNGFIMQELDLSDYFPLYSLYSSSFANKQGFPATYKKTISEKLIKGVKNAHDNNIVIGDLNPFNVMVNSRMDVKFIDVDSYQTESCKHNDKLLEDIRDYYYGGKVTQESDYFALSVIIFNLLTGIHPYKGIHNIYRDKLKDREINNISLLNKGEIKNIKIPKFYAPISDNALSDLFFQIYQNNKRFLIDIEGKHLQSVNFDAVVMSNELMVKNFYFDANTVKNVFTSSNYIAICTDKEKKLYSCEGRGIILNLGTVDKEENLILTDKNIFSIRDKHLRIYDKKGRAFVNIDNIVFENIHCIKQYENILTAITKNDKQYTVFLDNVYLNNVKFTVSDVYHKSFTRINGMFQTIGKHNIIFYNNGRGSLSQIVLEDNIKDIIQDKNTGIYISVEKGKIINKLFSIDAYGKIKVKQIDDICPYTSNDKFIILFKEDKLHFIDKETLNEVVSFKTDGLDGYGIRSSKSGIIAFNNVKVLILNTK